MTLPKDPVMLLSVVNTKLRDFYPSLDALAEDAEITKEEIVAALEKINYQYDSEKNQFV